MNRKLVLALLLALLPLTSRADMGSLDIGFILWLLVGAVVFWCVLAVAIYFILRKQKVAKAPAWALLFLVAPALLLAVEYVKQYALGTEPTERMETTQASRVIEGITFPAGTQIRYEQSGGFFGWHAQRELLEVRSSRPVMVGTLRINAYFPREHRLVLTGDQMIQGWPCSATSADITLDADGPHLRACELSAPSQWHGKLLPVGTMVGDQGMARALPYEGQ